MALSHLLIDHRAISDNVATIRRLLRPGVSLMVVVKADAFHHGAIEVARTALAAGADKLGVATFAEALELRDAGITAPIMAWLWHPAEDGGAALASALEQDIEIGVTSLEQARALLSVVEAPARVAVKVDTGIHRSAMPVTDLDATLDLLCANPHIEITGLFSHLACADDPASPETDRQAKRFRAAIDQAKARGLALPQNHLCNSPGTLTRPDLHFDLVRTGLAIYGHEPIDGREDGLRPAMTWRANILAVHPIAEGEGTCYGLTWRAPHDGYLAVVAVGYADGVPRAAQGHLKVGIRGELYPQVGRVCMDQLVVWLADNPAGITSRDQAVIFGEGGMSPTHIAQSMGTINYEVLCWPQGPRVARVAISSPTREGGGTRRTEHAQDTQQLGEELGAILQAGDVVVLHGPLGAGKTTFTQGIARGMEVRGKVTSPTFVIAREHRATKPGGATLVHVDAYRLLGEGAHDPEAAAEVDALGALDSLDLDTDLDDAVVVAEWGGGLVETLSERYLFVTLDRDSAVRENPDSEARVISWEWKTPGR